MLLLPKAERRFDKYGLVDVETRHAKQRKQERQGPKLEARYCAPGVIATYVPKKLQYTHFTHIRIRDVSAFRAHFKPPPGTSFGFDKENRFRLMATSDAGLGVALTALHKCDLDAHWKSQYMFLQASRQQIKNEFPFDNGWWVNVFTENHAGCVVQFNATHHEEECTRTFQQACGELLQPCKMVRLVAPSSLKLSCQAKQLRFGHCEFTVFVCGDEIKSGQKLSGQKLSAVLDSGMCTSASAFKKAIKKWKKAFKKWRKLSKISSSR